MAYKFTHIQNEYLDGKKITRFSMYYFIDGDWQFAARDYVYGWYKTQRSIANQIKREGGEIA